MKTFLRLVRNVTAFVVAMLCVFVPLKQFTCEAEAMSVCTVKEHVPESYDFMSYWSALSDLSPADGGGISTFGDVGGLVPLCGERIVVDSKIKLLSSCPKEEGGDGVVGWVTYSFSATPADSDGKSFPYNGGKKDGYYLEISNISNDDAKNRISARFVEKKNGVDSVVAQFTADGLIERKTRFILLKCDNGTSRLSFTDSESGESIVQIDLPTLDESLYVNALGQTYFSIAIWENSACDGNHSQHRSMNVYGMEVYTPQTDTAEIILEKENYIFDGTRCRPDVTIRIGEKTLTKDVDYYLEYIGTHKVGTAFVYIVFIGDYIGNEDIVKSFTISEKPSEDTSTDQVGSQKGCGSTIIASPVLLFVLSGAVIVGKKRK